MQRYTDETKSELVSILECTFSLFTDRELQILILRFGLNGNEEHTLAEIARYFDLSRERIRQLEMKMVRIIAWYLNRGKANTRKLHSSRLSLEERFEKIQKNIDRKHSIIESEKWFSET